MQRTKDSFEFYASSKKAGKSYQNSEKLGKKKENKKRLHVPWKLCFQYTRAA